MVSDYFTLTASERKKFGSEELIKNEIQSRIKGVAKFMAEYNSANTTVISEYGYVRCTCITSIWPFWAVAMKMENGTPIRVYINRAYFNRMVSEWNTTKRISIDEQDWRYIIMQSFKEDGATELSWANCTIAICNDIPPICIPTKG